MSVPHPHHPRHATTSSGADLGSMSLEKVGVRRFEWGDPYHLALTLSWPLFFAGMLGVYAVVNGLFALLYLAVPGCIQNMVPGSFAQAFFFSVETLATVGYGAMAPATLYGHVVATAEIFLGMMLTATMMGLVFVRFSRPKARILFADTAVLFHQDGKTLLMIRTGNGRINALMDATARVTSLVVEKAADGRLTRRAHDLHLARHELPYFPMTWTLIHEISSDSPVAHLALPERPDEDVRLLVSMTARDPSLAASVSAVKAYDREHILVGMRYADVVHWDGGNHSVADMRRLSEVEGAG